MRRLLILGVVAAATALLPTMATAGNQEVAEHIAQGLEESGQLYGCNVGVRYQNGVVWLKGDVCTHQQKETAQKLVLDTPGVVRVMNELSIGQDSLAQQLRQPQGSTQPEHHQTAATADAFAGPSDPIKMAPKAAPAVRPQRENLQPLALRQPESIASEHRDRVIQASALEESRPTPIADIALPTPAPMLAPAVPEPTPAVTVTSNVVEQPPAPQAIPQPIMQQPAPAVAAQPQPAHMQPVPVVAMREPVRMAYAQPAVQPTPAPQQQYLAPAGQQVAPARYDQPHMPNYAWPSYAASPNYGQLTYPKQYSPSAWPYIGPFYPYPQVPLGWRKVTMEWHDGWWYMDFDDGSSKNPFSAFFRPLRCK